MPIAFPSRSDSCSRLYIIYVQNDKGNYIYCFDLKGGLL